MDTTSVALLVGAYAISAVIIYACWIRRLGVPFLLVAILVGAIYWSLSSWSLTFMTGGEVKFIIAVPVSVQVGESALVGSLVGGLVAWCISLVRRHRPPNKPLQPTSGGHAEGGNGGMGRAARGRTTSNEQSMTRLDKKNDPDWCQQFFAPVFGLAFIAMGFLGLVGHRAGSIAYWQVGLGLAWLVRGFVHASRWRKKKRAFERALLDCFE